MEDTKKIEDMGLGMMSTSEISEDDPFMKAAKEEVDQRSMHKNMKMSRSMMSQHVQLHGIPHGKPGKASKNSSKKLMM